MTKLQVGQTWRLKYTELEVTIVEIGSTGKTVMFAWEHAGRLCRALGSYAVWQQHFEYVRD